jgi:hypothetical protein
MADQSKPDKNANKDKAEGERPDAGFVGGQGGPEVSSQQEAEDVLNRNAEERYDTPRRYEEGDVAPASAPDQPPGSR